MKKKKIHQNVGRYFRAKRIKSGLSQEEVVKSLGYTSIQIVSNWERGICSPPSRILKSLMKLYKIDKKEYLEFFISETRREYISLLGLRQTKKKTKK